DHPRPAVWSFGGGMVRMDLPEDFANRLERFGESRHSTPFMTLLAGFLALLHRWTGGEDVRVGIPAAGRGHRALEGLIGFFTQTLVLRADLSGRPTFRALLARTRAAALGAFAHADVPFERVVEALHPEREPGRDPLFQAVFTYHRAAEEAYEAAGVRFAPRQVDAALAKFDLQCSVAEEGDGWRVSLQYDAGLFAAGTVRGALDAFAALLAGAAEAPDAAVDDLPLLDAEARARVLAWARAPRGEADAGRPAVPELFRRRVAERPDAVALRWAGASVTYAELDRRAAGVARLLRDRGIGPGAVVGLCLERTPGAVAAMLGVMRSGAAYAPLDAAWPAERMRFVLDDCGAALVLAPAGLAAALPAEGPPVLPLEAGADGEAGDDPGIPIDPDAPAYLTYTSGSTGTPKATVVPHRALAGCLHRVSYARFGAETVMLQHSSLLWDAAVLELWAPLAHGGTSVLFPARVPSADDLRRVVAEEGVETLFLTTSLFSALLEADPECFRGLRQLIVGGEALLPAHARRFRALHPGIPLVNGYGPSECTVFTTAYAVPAEVADGPSSVLIGTPVGDRRAYVLDGRMRPVPPGMPGELYAGGPAVPIGYLRRPALTAAALVPDPFAEEPGARLYRTGDRARWTAEGVLEFLGRVDGQVKLRGYRIETGEVEAALAAHPGVAQAAAVVREDRPGDRRLVAYVIPAGGAAPDGLPAELRRALLARLPGPLVPSAIVVVEALPRTPTGKVDRRALPAPAAEAPAGPAFVPAATSREARVAEVWREVLWVERVGAHDNFFDLGGHSLLLTRVHARLRALGEEVSLLDLFRHPTVAALARHLAGGAEPAPAAPSPRPSPAAADDVAVVGMSVRLPGAPDVEAYWRALLDGVQSARRFTDAELAEAGVPEALRRRPEFVPVRAVVAGADRFDARLFGFTPREAETTDPQKRVFLECAWEALEHAAHDPARRDARVGVFAGSGFNAYFLDHLYPNRELLQAQGLFALAIRNDKDFLATMAAYRLGLRGPAVSVQTACSTSLVAVHLACQSLHAGDCDLALAGGASISVPEVGGYLCEEGGILSRAGRCRPFDASADGIIPGNGAAVVVLKRLRDALADGDVVHAVIRGSAINNDGSDKVGFTAPAIEGQREVVQAALASAGVDPGSVGFVEAHGTGTPLGDPIEVAALAAAYGGGDPRPARTALGSVKSNVGHVDTAAGVAGLVKAVLAVREGVIPPTAGFRAPNPVLGLEGTPFFVNPEAMPWPEIPGPRRAAVSSLGIGGTNAHVIVEEPPAAPARGPGRPLPQLLVLSARTATALEARARGLADHLERHPGAELADVAHTLRAGRRRLEHRRAVVAGDRAEAVAALRGGGAAASAVDEARDRGVVFLFPGLGSQHAGMARGLMDAFPDFRAELEHCARVVREAGGPELLRWIAGAHPGDPADTAVVQPLVFSVDYALARLWMRWGVAPRALLGHSLGELVAAALAGVMSLDDALRLVVARGRLCAGAGPGAMSSVRMAEEEVRPLLEPRLAIASRNAPRAVAVAGPVDAVAEFERRAEAAGGSPRRIEISCAHHSALLDPVLDAFEAEAAAIALHPPAIPFVSGLTGRWITPEEATSPRYWARHLREPVEFHAGIRAAADGDPVFLEAGAGRALGAFVRQTLGAGARTAASLPRSADPAGEPAALLAAVGQLWAAGVPVEWETGAASPRKVVLPGYPFERQRYWIDPPRSVHASASAAVPADVAPSAGPRGTDAGAPAAPLAADGEVERTVATVWREVLGVAAVAGEDDFFLLGGDSMMASRAAARLQEAFGAPIPVRLFFDAASLADFADRVSAHLAASGETSARGPADPLPDGAAPRGGDEVERAVATIWREVLGVPEVSPYDDFFALGGDSLMASRAAARLQEALGRPVPVRLLFDCASLRELAGRLAAEGGAGAASRDDEPAAAAHSAPPGP
ncbi:MAG TPA: amino acid adenylation domain-containing protein, partial [Longimicrobium sp.]|nr:amino acid adenylation domain-containing protein [Longimicrobium sp.]